MCSKTDGNVCSYAEFQARQTRKQEAVRERVSQHSTQEQRSNDPMIKDLIIDALRLRKAPKDWREQQLVPGPNALMKVACPLEVARRGVDVTQDLALYARHVLEDYALYPDWYCRSFEHYVHMYVDSGEPEFLHMAGQTALLWYAAGPLTLRDDPTAFRSRHHRWYEVALATYGVTAYRKYYILTADTVAEGMIRNFQHVGRWMRACVLAQYRQR